MDEAPGAEATPTPGGSSGGSSGPRAGGGRRLILAGAVIVLLLVGVVVALRVPNSKPAAGFGADAEDIDPQTAVVVYLRIDSFDAAKGTLAARVRAVAGPALPAQGARVAVGDGGRPELKVGPGAPSTEQTLVLDVDRGTVSSYPFDQYDLEEVVAAVSTDSSIPPGGDGSRTLPLQVIGASTAAGFAVTGTAGGAANDTVVDLELAVERVRPQVVWATGMMAIDWALAVAVVAVALALVLRERPWETRHLAWLGSMIFALAAFRNTAPGNPPIGVFLDFAAFFWAEALVVASLLALVVVYLLRSRADLDL